MTRYAADTSVSPESSQAEIRRVLRRYDATSGFAFAEEAGRAMIGFTVKGRRVRFALALPSPTEKRFQFTEHKGLKRDTDAALKAWEQACRQSWRALALVIKAKLEAIESGITSFDEEFLAHLVLPNNQTVTEVIVPKLTEALATAQMQPLPPFLP